MMPTVKILVPLVTTLFSLVNHSVCQIPLLSGEERDDVGCDIAKCITGPCAQFEQCLLVAQRYGCSPRLITNVAALAYERCLFGKDGFCGLSPLVECYTRNIEQYTNTPVPELTATSPTRLAEFISLILEDAADVAAPKRFTQCSISAQSARNMTYCVLNSANTIAGLCENVMSLATNRYFYNNHQLQSLKNSTNRIVDSLANYTSICSRFGQWTRWFNDVHPTPNNGSDIEITEFPCRIPGVLPRLVDCTIDTDHSQLCKSSDECPKQQVGFCGINTAALTSGLTCLAKDQAETSAGQLCPCCDYRVRYLCPVDVQPVVYPPYGPEVGNTSITIIGLPVSSGPIFITIGQQLPCSIEEITQYKVVCRTPALPGGLAANRESRQPIFASGQDINSSFTYRQKPAVERVYNLNTLVSGGTDVKIEGENFLSLTLSTMTVRIIYKDPSGAVKIWVYQSDCRIESDTVVSCPVPALINPFEFTPNVTSTNVPTVLPAGGGFISQLSRSLTAPIDEDSETFTSSWRKSLLRLTGAHASPFTSRHKRATCGEEKSGDAPINDNDDLTYELTIDLDGIIIEGNTLNVYVDPQIDIFPESPSCRVFSSWLLKQDKEMEITGARLNDGLGCSEYKIRVGQGDCSLMDLYTNKIICQPPNAAPQPGDMDVEGRLGVEVMIANGRLRFEVGCLQYEDDLLDNEFGLYGLIAGLALLIVIIFCVALCCCCHFKNKKKQ